MAIKGIRKKLAGTHWGANSKIIKTVYKGAVRPTLEYGASARATAAKTHTNKLDCVQNIGLRTILGAMRSTPKAMMEKTAGVEPLESRRQAKLLTHAEKMKRLPDHPLHNRLQDLTKNRLKRISLNHLVKQHQKRQIDILTDNPELCERLNPSTWPQKRLLGEIRTNIPGITVKKDQSNIEQTMEEIDKCYPATTRWKSVLQLQSGTPGTLQCYRGSETVGKKTPKSSISLRLPFSIAVLDL